MKVKRTSWHYKAATLFLSDEPTNLCSYMWRLVFLFPFLSVLMGFMFAFYYLIVLVAILAYGILGARPTKAVFYCDWDKAHFVSYPGLSIGRFCLFPWHLLLPALIVWLEVIIYRHWGMRAIWWEVGVAGFAVAGIVVLALVAFLGFSLELTMEWLHARKQKVCPLIEYEDDKETKPE